MSSNIDMREAFQKRLSETLQSFSKEAGAKAKKLGISFKQTGAGEGNLTFVFVDKGQGCYLIADAFNERFERFIASLDIPYRPRILAKTTYLYSTLSDKERGPPFSQTALIETPKSEPEIDGICQILKEKIIPVHIERILDCIELRESLLPRIETRPGDFSYPFPLYCYTLKKNGGSTRDVDLEHLARIGVVSNKRFDAALLDRDFRM